MICVLRLIYLSRSPSWVCHTIFQTILHFFINLRGLILFFDVQLFELCLPVGAILYLIHGWSRNAFIPLWFLDDFIIRWLFCFGLYLETSEV